MKDEPDFIRSLQEGRRDAFNTLVLEHQKILVRVIQRFVGDRQLAEDVVQETFLKAFLRIRDFEGRSSVRTWLIQIAFNTAKNKLRSLRRKTIEFQDLMIFDWDALNSEEEYHAKDFNKKVAQQVSQLPEKQRMAFRLRVFSDLSFAEISELMKCPYDTAKANYRHGLLKIKQTIKRFL